MTCTAFIDDIPFDLAYRAFCGTSFSPERRAASYRKDYADTLSADIATFEKQAALGHTAHLLPEAIARYRKGYLAAYIAWLNAKSRCLSSMITGPSNFPVRRAQRANAAEHARCSQLIDYRQRVSRAIVRELRPDLRPIMAGDADAIARLAVKIDQLERDHALRKSVNAAIRQYAPLGQEKQKEAVMALGLSETDATALIWPCRGRTVGYAPYSLSYATASIRANKARLASLEKMHSLPMIATAHEAKGLRIEDDPPVNRIRLVFDAKPDQRIRTQLKANGFRWAPSNGAWQAYRNPKAMTFAQTFAAAPA